MLFPSASALIDLRKQAIDLFRIGIAAAQPGPAVAAALGKQFDQIHDAKRVILIAFGKAACAMTRAALPFVANKLHKAIVVTNAENMALIEGVETIIAGHPLPDEGSLAAGVEVEKLARSAEPGDLVLVLVSGGGSALVCAPADTISIADKIALNDALIRSGADITEINAVRQHFSKLKGGRLAQLASRARTLALIVSDVPGDDIRVIASGPTAAPCSSFAETRNLLSKYDIDQRFRDALLFSEDDMTLRARSSVENIVIGSNSISLARVMASAAERNMQVIKADDWLSGNVRDASLKLHRMAHQEAQRPGLVAIVAGGETTVEVKGTGRGGRNQELALRFALANDGNPVPREWAFLSAGTDGRDGPTDAAGAIVDAGSTAAMRTCGHEPSALLENNDSFAALELSGDLLITGATGTNVSDLQILLMR